MTGNMLAAVEHSEFEDCTYVAAMLHYFTDFYFTALESYGLEHGRTPAVGLQVFDAAQDTETHSLHNLFQRVIAHFSYVLVIALMVKSIRSFLKLSIVSKTRSSNGVACK